MSKFLLQIMAFTIIVFGLEACQTVSNNSNVGSGPISLSPEVKLYFEQYKTYDGWGFFAVSPDGKHYGFGGCPSLGACYNDGSQAALRRCKRRNRGESCKIYADGPNIVWQGVADTYKKITPTDVSIGTGPLSLSYTIQQKIRVYLALDDPLAFAVSVDGTKGFGIYCSNTPCTFGGEKEAAITRCKELSPNQPCYLYAVGRKIVWRGKIAEEDSNSSYKSTLERLTGPSFSPPPPPKVNPNLQGVRCLLNGTIARGMTLQDCEAKGGKKVN